MGGELVLSVIIALIAFFAMLEGHLLFSLLMVIIACEVLAP